MRSYFLSMWIDEHNLVSRLFCGRGQTRITIFRRLIMASKVVRRKSDLVKSTRAYNNAEHDPLTPKTSSENSYISIPTTGRESCLRTNIKLTLVVQNILLSSQSMRVSVLLLWTARWNSLDGSSSILVWLAHRPKWCFICVWWMLSDS